MGRQWLGRYGKTDNGVVTVSTLWADDRVYSPLAVELARRARPAGVAFRAVVADCAYGDHDGVRAELRGAGLPFVMALTPHRGTWAYGPDAHTPVDAARQLTWNGPDDPGDWTAVTRAFRDGHTATGWVAEARLGWWGPDGNTRLVVATTDPARLPDASTWRFMQNFRCVALTRHTPRPLLVPCLVCSPRSAICCHGRREPAPKPRSCAPSGPDGSA